MRWISELTRIPGAHFCHHFFAEFGILPFLFQRGTDSLFDIVSVTKRQALLLHFLSVLFIRRPTLFERFGDSFAGFFGMCKSPSYLAGIHRFAFDFAIGILLLEHFGYLLSRFGSGSESAIFGFASSSLRIFFPSFFFFLNFVLFFRQTHIRQLLQEAFSILGSHTGRNPCFLLRGSGPTFVPWCLSFVGGGYLGFGRLGVSISSIFRGQWNVTP
mmetsp:Transcript_26472/g.55376  ORF Transcript_26472/g.55376 Transcript_26472/m.55376 type:complete len:215 (-) Transcript_26472:148-792(-)